MAEAREPLNSDPNAQTTYNKIFLLPDGTAIREADLIVLLSGLPKTNPSNGTSQSKTSATPERSVAQVKIKSNSTPSRVKQVSSSVSSNGFISSFDTPASTDQASNPVTSKQKAVLACSDQVVIPPNMKQQDIMPTNLKQILIPISPNVLSPTSSANSLLYYTPTTTPVRANPNTKAKQVTPKAVGIIANDPTTSPAVPNGSPNIPLAASMASTLSKQQQENKNAMTFATLVFFDLETTGLGHIIGKSNVQITEISMVAIDRKEFWQSQNSELKDVRIIHKLSMCVRPRSAVSPGAAKITGLDNFNLVDQYPFDRNAASTIISFLAHLPKPVCLLAHNGNAFDFPLLKAELKRLSMELPSDLYIADTLLAFKSIGIAESPPDRKVCKSVKFGKNGRLSHSLENLHLFFFNKKPTGGHSSEGDCLALAKVCHKLKDDAIPWLEAHAQNLDNITPMW